MGEIKVTPVDRQALDILLRAFPATRGVDANRAGIEVLNDLWSRMASALAKMTEEDFDAAERATEASPQAS